MDAIHLNKVVKEYAPGARAVDAVDLEVRSGEFLVLVGPSGCGKSTLLRMIAGLEQVTSGTIAMGGRDVTHVAARDRDVAMVFQNYALYPHMSVRANIGYGLRVRGAKKDRVARRVDEVAAMLDLSDLLDRRPAALSGGQRQRVAMGRAIARAPQVYLMDEPLSNLDAKLRVTMRAGLERLHAQLGVTTIYVTHDQIEAMTLGQRAAVLRDGVLQQVASPQELYQRPVNAFVAAFIGSPAMNFAVGRLYAGTVAFGPVSLPLPEALRPAIADDTPVLVGIRPEGLGDPRLKPRDAMTIEVPVAVREDLGHETLLFFSVDSPRVDVAGVASTATAGIGNADRALFCARVGADFPARTGETATLAIMPEALHFFDPDSGAALARAGRLGAAVVR